MLDVYVYGEDPQYMLINTTRDPRYEVSGENVGFTGQVLWICRRKDAWMPTPCVDAVWLA